MNAPTAAAALRPSTIDYVSVAAIIPSQTQMQQLRRQRFTKESIDELAESIKSIGVLEPIILRPIHGRGDYALVAGERRWLACKRAGVNHVPATVRELTEEQVLEVQLVENLQREDPHPLEEAEGYEALMKLKKINAEAVADMIGKSKSYVFKRTKLLALCPEARKAFYSGQLDSSVALEVARIGHHDTQRAALKDVSEGVSHWIGGRRPGQPMTFREAREHILKTYMLRLKSAPFDLVDPTLVPKAGDCLKCPKRTGNQRELFGDVKDLDTCTDPKCFDEKRQAHFAIARRRLEAAGHKVVHGEAAKKAIPHWELGREHDERHLQGGYIALDETTYASGRGRKVAEILPAEYQPILLQHPGTGKIIKVATQQAVAAAASRGKKGKTMLSAPKQKKPKGPDIDELLRDRLVKRMHEKAPKEFGKAHYLALAETIADRISLNKKEAGAIAKAFGWPAGAFAGYSWSVGFPKKHAPKLSPRDLMLLAMDTLFATTSPYTWEKRGNTLLSLFGIDGKKERAALLEERKAARAKAKK